MMRFLIYMLLLLCVAGCAMRKELQPTISPEQNVSPEQNASRKLASALKELEQDRTAAASKILEEIVAAPEVKGVTDEALFRLSILKLLSEEKDGAQTATLYLERLRRDYRDSSWAPLAKPLLDVLNNAAELKKQNRNLKTQNSSLTKDNKELRQSIERLKSLDLQLERKTR